MQAVLFVALAGVFGDLWNWVEDVFARIGDVAVYWLVLGLAFKTGESALLGLVWRNILRAAYPKSLLSFKTAWGASQGGTAINALVPAQGGTAAMIGIFRASIPGSSVAGIGRIACNIIFMFAFGIPVTAFTVFLVASSHMLSGLFAITPGGVGQTQALDVASLSGYVASGTVAAFSITQDSVITIWNVVLGLGVMLWAFGFEQVKTLLSRKSPEQAKAPT